LGTYAADPQCDSKVAVLRFLGGDPLPWAPAKAQARPIHIFEPQSPNREGNEDGDGDGDGDDEEEEEEEDEDVKGGIEVVEEAPACKTLGVSEPTNLNVEIDKCDGGYERTKALLGFLISKPRLSDRLLARPPIRFLHDIIMELIRVTNFGQGLYSAEETDSANLKEKEQKILFLKKMIQVVGVQLNTVVQVKARKIVAGLEPQETNRFFQLFALSARMMPDSRQAVRIVCEQFTRKAPLSSCAETTASLIQETDPQPWATPPTPPEKRHHPLSPPSLEAEVKSPLPEPVTSRTEPGSTNSPSKHHQTSSPLVVPRNEIEIRSPLSSGGCSVVYRAEWRGSMVAVKVRVLSFSPFPQAFSWCI
jgi:hypothetical protein